MSAEFSRTSSATFPTYGSYTKQQLEFMRDHTMVAKTGGTLLDPMCGSANLLSIARRLGVDVVGWDVNPAVLIVGAMRDPIAQISDSTFDALENEISKRPLATAAQAYTADWIPENTAKELQRLGSIYDASSVFTTDGLVSRANPEGLLLVGACVLAARRISAFRRTKNATWLKSGGIPAAYDWRLPVIDALASVHKRWSELPELTPPITFQARSALRPVPELAGAFDAIITSPPYPNRLDYTRMWGPELAVLARVTGEVLNPGVIAMGSNQVSGFVVPDDWASLLPELVTKPLNEVREKPSKASDSYYFPYFAKYFLELRVLIQNIVDMVRPGGRCSIFVRDVIRTDVLLPVGDYVSALLAELGLRPVAIDRAIVRHHIGLRRRTARGSQYGDAQIEWSLCYER